MLLICTLDSLVFSLVCYVRLISYSIAYGNQTPLKDSPINLVAEINPSEITTCKRNKVNRIGQMSPIIGSMHKPNVRRSAQIPDATRCEPIGSGSKTTTATTLACQSLELSRLIPCAPIRWKTQCVFCHSSGAVFPPGVHLHKLIQIYPQD